MTSASKEPNQPPYVKAHDQTQQVEDTPVWWKNEAMTTNPLLHLENATVEVIWNESNTNVQKNLQEYTQCERAVINTLGKLFLMIVFVTVLFFEFPRRYVYSMVCKMHNSNSSKTSSCLLPSFRPFVPLYQTPMTYLVQLFHH
jgi:hypothetical protein